MRWVEMQAMIFWFYAHTYVAGSRGDLRLVSNDPSSPESGRLEIFLNNAWGTVCMIGFDVYEADLACRQLGYLYADRVDTVDSLR